MTWQLLAGLALGAALTNLAYVRAIRAEIRKANKLEARRARWRETSRR